MAVPREMHEVAFFSMSSDPGIPFTGCALLFRSLFAKGEGREVISYPMNSRKTKKGCYCNGNRMLFYLYLENTYTCHAMTPKKVRKWTNENRKRERCGDAI
jgi:hypothetical protein